MKKPLITLGIITLGINSVLISGCANAALAATDPRSISTTTSDQYIKRDLSISYMSNEYENDHISVDAYNHQVLLTGQASNYTQREKAVKEASQMSGVRKVYDYLVVSPKYNSTTMADTTITAKIKTQLFSTENINSNDVQIITSSGVVYIMGIIYESQQKKMINIARSVDGVKKVVPILQYKRSDTKMNLSD